MSSKKAVYESSTLCSFGADEDLTDSVLVTVGTTAGLMTAAGADERDGFALGFGAAVSLLTRTDAGTCIYRKKRQTLYGKVPKTKLKSQNKTKHGHCRVPLEARRNKTWSFL